MCIAIALVLPALPAAHGEDSTGKDRPRLRAGGRLGQVFGSELAMLGDLWADLPLLQLPAGELYSSVDARSSVERATEFAFRIRDLQYQVDLGFRSRRGWVTFLGQRGRDEVDENGKAHVRYLGVGFDARRPRLDWSVALGPVLEDRALDVDGFLRGSARLELLRLGFAGASLHWDLETEGLWIDGDYRADLRTGPRVHFPLEHRNSISFFLHYHRNRDPLGIREDLTFFGFAYETDDPSPQTPRGEAPAVAGLVAAGAGPRRSARLQIKIASPPFASDSRGIVKIDANILTGRSTDDLFYFADVGWERPTRGFLAGAYLYHRSNHQLGSANPRLTSLNVLEGGIETLGRGSPGRRVGRRLEGWARAGWLVESDFGEDRHWHLRGGARWNVAVGGRIPLFVKFDGELGDIERAEIAAGVALSPRLELQLAYLDDEQLFDPDREIWSVSAIYGF